MRSDHITDPKPLGCRRWGVVLLLGLVGIVSPVAEAGREQGYVSGVSDTAIEIRRTTDGIPHIRAVNWRDLGVGVGYAQAQDALCSLAEAFMTYEGKRSQFLGADQRPTIGSSMGMPKNIDSDFFFRAFVDQDTIARLKVEQPVELSALVEGFAEGYNRQLRVIKQEPSQHAHRTCRTAAWLREITADDVYRRMYAAQLMAGYLQFLPDIVNAVPNGVKREHVAMTESLRKRLANNLGAQAELGSNAIAWGGQATGGDGAVLLGNPHWYWGGPDRFYQMQLTIPGQLNVAGVGFLGVPLVMIGFNENIAWSHTVSTARRFGLFQLLLDPDDPYRYLVDGVSEPMQARVIHMEVTDAAGELSQVSRTFYTSRFGPIVDLGRLDPGLGWGAGRAVAIRDINAANWWGFRNFLAWGQARSLDDFVGIQTRQAAMPWVNTVAIGKSDERVWYADIGAVPNAPDSLRERCSAPLAEAFSRFDPRTPFLDGSRSQCDWLIDSDAVQPGALPVSRLPSLFREDYVANMNDSYWLANLYQPLEGFAALLGGERLALRTRGRLGHQIAIGLLQAGARSSKELSQWVMREALSSRSYSADQFKQTLLVQACSVDALQTVDAPAIVQACDVLRAWKNTGEGEDRGALLWDAFWGELEQLPEDQLYQQAFSIAAPLRTPGMDRPAQGLLVTALLKAVAALQAQGVALDAAPASHRYVRSAGQRWPMYGGCGELGYFTTVCPAQGDGYVLGPNVVANSYLQVVRFADKGVEAHTLLAHGEDELAVSNGPGSAPVARYSAKDWLKFPFQEADILSDPQLVRTVLRP